MPESVRRVRRKGLARAGVRANCVEAARLKLARTGVDQCDRVNVPDKLWQLRCVAISQGQNLLGPLDYHGLPPAIIGRLMSQDHVADANLLPTAR